MPPPPGSSTAWQPEIEVDFFQVETSGVTVCEGSSWRARKVMRPEQGGGSQHFEVFILETFFLRDWLMGKQETPS